MKTSQKFEYLDHFGRIKIRPYKIMRAEGSKKIP
jgi:hypothetical protein